MLEELVLVALPIGNLEDMTIRASKTLKNVDGVLAEDTRKFKEFCRMSGLELSIPVQSFDSHCEREADSKKLFEKLNGKWALVSDAGTPGVNDPGALLVKWARHQRVKVSAVPGASALTLALQLSGGFGNPVTFLGFTPKKVKAEFFEDNSSASTLVFFETKHNVLHTLNVLLSSKFSHSRLHCLREMTKTHEDFFEGSIQEHIQYFEERLAEDRVGELTFVLEGLSLSAQHPVSIQPTDLLSFRNAAPSQAAKILSKLCNITRDQAYDLLKGV